MNVPPGGLTREAIAAIYLAGDGIEIGALQAPLHLPSQARVRYVDRLAKDALYRHYPELAGSTYLYTACLRHI